MLITIIIEGFEIVKCEAFAFKFRWTQKNTACI